MRNNEFTLKIDEISFSIEIVQDSKGGSFLFCKPSFEKNSFFFMNKDDDGNWKIQHRHLAPKSILMLEFLLNEKLAEVQTKYHL